MKVVAKQLVGYLHSNMPASEVSVGGSSTRLLYRDCYPSNALENIYAAVDRGRVATSRNSWYVSAAYRH